MCQVQTLAHGFFMVEVKIIGLGKGPVISMVKRRSKLYFPMP